LEREEIDLDMITFCQNAYDVANGVDALVVVTEWNEFSSLNMPEVRRLMRRPVLIDGRNIYKAEEMSRLGFSYRGIGRGNTGTDAAALLLTTEQMDPSPLAQEERSVQTVRSRG
jgi:UDPglucose 6-dehydrogenase